MTTTKKPYNKPRKSYKVTPKPRHYKVVAKLAQGLGITRAMKESGYSTMTSEKAQKGLTESKGFIQAMSECGLDIATLNGYLASDLKAKKENRLGELTLAYKLHGKLRDTVQENKTLILITSGESATRYNVAPSTTPEVTD